MSDLHITEYGSEIWKTDTKSHFDRAIEQISQIDDIDCIWNISMFTAEI